MINSDKNFIDQIVFMKYSELDQSVLSNIKFNSNWLQGKLILLIQIMKRSKDSAGFSQDQI